MPRRPPRIVPAVLAAAGLALCAAPAAQATLLYEPTGRECHLAASPGWDVAGPALADPLGYRYDAGSADDGYATLDEGSTDLLKVGVLADDAWDRFGALMVGPSRSSVSLYRDPATDALGCSTELSGRQLVFKPVAMGGLSAQRRLFVSASQGSGARLLDSVTNAGSTPITTNVYVGDLRAYNDGSLGSDSTTKLAATSSSDTTLTTADRWAVTTDGRSIGSDPALAHVWAGVGADEPVSLVRSGAQTGGVAALDSPAALDEDQLGWGWEGVTLAPGETRSFLSWETMRASVDGKAATQAPLAAAAAEAQSTAPLPRVYEGLTAAQIGGVRNWAKPAVSATIAPVTGASAAADTTLTASNIDFGSSTLAACTTGTLAWDFGDGTTATGSTVTHRFAPGTAQVALTVTGTCGDVAVVQQAFSVAPAPTPAAAPQSPAEPTTPAASAQANSPAAALPLPAEPAEPGEPVAAPASAGPALAVNVAPKLSATELGKRGVRPTLVADAPGTVRLVLSGGGLKIVKTKQVVPGVETPAAMKLGPGDARRVRGLKTLQLRAKLTLAGGAEVITSRVITVSR